MMWYGLLHASHNLFLPLLGVVYLCIHFFFIIIIIIFFLQVKVPLPTTGKISEEEVVTTSSAGFPGMEEEAPGGDITEEAR